MLAIYQAGVQNVRELKVQRKSLKRLLNESIRRKDRSTFDVLTRMFALLYSAFAEVCFLKMIHTPYGLLETEIEKITNNRNLEDRWVCCIEIIFQKIYSEANKDNVIQKKDTVLELVTKYIIEPSQVRNKIAHGQWKVALNSENTAINKDTTKRIDDLDFVQVDILFSIYDKLGQVVEDLIESPHKTHYRDFYDHLCKLEELIEDTKTWTISSKIDTLNEKFLKQQQDD